MLAFCPSLWMSTESLLVWVSEWVLNSVYEKDIISKWLNWEHWSLQTQSYFYQNSTEAGISSEQARQTITVRVSQLFICTHLNRWFTTRPLKSEKYKHMCLTPQRHYITELDHCLLSCQIQLKFFARILHLHEQGNVLKCRLQMQLSRCFQLHFSKFISGNRVKK